MTSFERRIKIIKMLYSRNHETMGNLSVELGVSKKTIQRDITELSRIIPIYTRSGRYNGGVYLLNKSTNKNFSP